MAAPRLAFSPFRRMVALTLMPCACRPRTGLASRGWTSRVRSPAASPTPGTRRRGPGPTASAARNSPAITSSPSTMARSATSCAASPLPAAASLWFRPRPRPKTFCDIVPTGCSFPTAPETQRRPANTPCRSCARCSTAACPSSASAWAISFWRWPSAAGPTSWRAATEAQTSRSRTSPPVEWRSQARTTALRLTAIAAGERQGHPRLPVRRLQRGHRQHRPPRLLRPVPPGSQSWPHRQPSPVPPVCGDDGTASLKWTRPPSGDCAPAS